ncbi:hypothetical protein M3D63_03020 [Kocuria palustris]|nr:hypothetical protein KPaMU14_02675 [Kocuria palustris]MCT1833756.1 hypothetical protein [Kocuria palustris]
MPTSILADAIRTRRGMKWGPVAMLLALPYFAATVWVAGLIDQGAPRWLHVLVLLTIWNGFKMLWLGPASVAWLTRARLRETGAPRAQRRAVARKANSVAEPDLSELMR